MFACAEDVTTLENFAYGDTPTAEAIASLLGDVLGGGPTFDVSMYDLSNVHDTRPLVVETLLTYLVLAGVLEATGTTYSEYKIKPHRPVAEILARFDTRRAAFLRDVLGRARRGTTWLTLDPEAVGHAIGEPRERISKALGYLEGEGEITLQASGFRQGYRISSAAPDVERLRDVLVGRFQRRESREVARVGQMLEFARAGGCITRRLLDYFGEDLGRECGHCGPCLGEAPSAPSKAPTRMFGPQGREILRQARAIGHEILKAPRPLARFVCGLSSPAISRSGLAKHPLFGALADVPFDLILSLAEGRRARDTAGTGPDSAEVV
jgi:ATP-dependent DNA helicase RecQ